MKKDDVQTLDPLEVVFPRVVSLKDAAEVLGTSPDNLRGAIRRGSLGALKMGRDWWVPTGEVERYARENRRA